MSPHQINAMLRSSANAGAMNITDPGNGGKFAIGDRFFAYCDLTPAGGGETRVLPVDDTAIPPGAKIFLRNKSDTHSISITNGAVSITLAANTGLECCKVNYVGDLPRHWLGVAYAGGS